MTRIKYIYPVWLAIKWLVIVTIVSRSGGCDGDFGGFELRLPPSDDWITTTSPLGDGMHVKPAIAQQMTDTPIMLDASYIPAPQPYCPFRAGSAIA